MRRSGWVGVRSSIVLAVFGLLTVGPSSALACSPPFDAPTINDLGPDRVVLVGTTGDPAPDGRWFHVERWFGAGEPAPAIVIAFQEGAATGDCSYPVAKDTRLIIAPEISEGRLTANILTIQADPDSELGQAYLDEATAVFGPGVVPEALPDEAESFALDPGVALAMIVAAIGGVVGILAFTGLPRRGRR